MNNKLREFVNSKGLIITLKIIGGLLIILTAFKAGEYEGFRKASFSTNWGRAMYRNITQTAGTQNKFGKRIEDDVLTAHGLVGPIVQVSSSSIVITDRDKAEKNILIATDTIIRRFRNEIPSSELSKGEWVAVIGAPDEDGEIQAKLIRAIPNPVSQPATTTSR